MEMRFHTPSGGGKTATFVVKGKDIKEIKDKLKEILEEWRGKKVFEDIIFSIERQIGASDWCLLFNEIAPGAFCVEGQKRIMEDNKGFLKFLKKEFGIELTDKEKILMWRELENRT